MLLFDLLPFFTLVCLVNCNMSLHISSMSQSDINSSFNLDNNQDTIIFNEEVQEIQSEEEVDLDDVLDRTIKVQ